MAGGSGAVVTFRGVVRGDAGAGRRVEALVYEAYADMAEREIDRLVAEARRRWRLDAARVEHRVGLVAVGQVSVVVIVAAQHRAEAYAASRFLIDQIKRRVPIWKREQYDDGTSEWTTCAASDAMEAAHAHV